MANAKTAQSREHPIRVEEGSGDVFADVGLRNPEELLVKAEIVCRLVDILDARELGQVEAAKLLGISQPRVSDLSRGRLDKFSLEKLLDFAKRLGSDVEIRFRPSTAKKARLRVISTANGRKGAAFVRSRTNSTPSQR